MTSPIILTNRDWKLIELLREHPHCWYRTPLTEKSAEVLSWTAILYESTDYTMYVMESLLHLIDAGILVRENDMLGWPTADKEAK